MKKYISFIAMAIMMTIVLIACSNNEQESDQVKADDETKEASSEEDNTDEEDEEYYDTLESSEESQKGLEFGEKGTVISGEIGNMRHTEVTPISVEKLDEFYDEEYEKTAEPRDGVFVKVTSEIENIDVKAFTPRNIIRTSLIDKEVDDQLYEGTMVEKVFMDGEEIDEEDEFQPGEKITVEYIFDMEDASDYTLAYGGSHDQVITYAQWDIVEEDFE